jgi:peroxiredoxin
VTITTHPSIGVVFFSHPGSFTPVCTTELAEVAKLDAEWKARNVKVIGISANSVQSHRDHMKDVEQLAGCQVGFPLIGDKSRHVTKLYSMLDEADGSNVDEVSFLTTWSVRPERTVTDSHALLLVSLSDWLPTRCSITAHPRPEASDPTDAHLSGLYVLRLPTSSRVLRSTSDS